MNNSQEQRVSEQQGRPTRTAVLEVRCDARSLAMLLSYYTQHGVAVRSKSELVAMIVDDLADILDIPPINETGQAIHILEAYFGSGALTRTDRGRSNRITQMRAEDTGSGAKHQTRSITRVQNTALAQSAVDILPPGFDLDAAVRMVEENLAKSDADFMQKMSVLPTASAQPTPEVEDE